MPIHGQLTSMVPCVVCQTFDSSLPGSCLLLPHRFRCSILKDDCTVCLSLNRSLDVQEKVPAAAASGPIIVKSVSRIITGRSVLGNGGLRIPTVFAPLYSGYKFMLQAVESPPGTTLELRNMTVVIADGVFTELHSSGMMDYFDLGTAARVCFMNR